LEGLQYNTQREQLKIPEYGRNIKTMIDYAISIEDREERNKIAKAIISVMGQLNPHLRDVEDFAHKLWDHLFIISDFKLDVDSPYPMPEIEVLEEKPELLGYSKGRIKYAYYGKSVSFFIEEALKMEEGEMKDALVVEVANLMKRSFLIWNKDHVDDDVIISHLAELSDGMLKLKDESLIKDADVLVTQSNRRKNYKSYKNNNNNKNNNYKRNNRNHKYKKRN